jgi:hypothetical protein
VVAPVLQRNDVPPDAVSVDEPPTQLDGLEGVMLHTGAGFSDNVSEHEDVQPLSDSVTVTVYVVVAVGLTVMDAVVAPVLQRNESPPDAVSVDESPAQIAGSVEVMLHTGAVVSAVTITSAKQLFAGLIVSCMVKRYVPGAVIKIESRPTLSLIPGPMDTLFSVQSNTGFIMSV